MTTLGASCDALLYVCTPVTLRRNKGVACSSTGTWLLSVRFGATASAGSREAKSLPLTRYGLQGSSGQKCNLL